MIKIALLIALSVVGSFIKIPSPVGTIAFDSLPGFVGAVLLGIWPGAVIGALGHLTTALSAGFPLTIPVHLLIARNKIIAILLAVIINAPLSLALLSPLYGWGFFYAMIIPLTIGSLLNLLLATLVLRYVKHA
jgi:hypothetical protein